MRQRIKQYKEKVDIGLISRQRIFFVIITIFIIIDIVNVINGKISILLAISGFLLTTILGLILSRIFKIHWHTEKQKVVSRLDILGVIFLVFYMIIEIGRKWFLGHWLSGASLSSFVLIIPTGLILGRFLGTSMKINKILLENEKPDEK